MKSVAIDQFKEYAFLSGVTLAPHAENAAFICAKTDMTKNGYNRDLWLLPENGAARRLTTDGKAGGFLWDHFLVGAAAPQDPCAYDGWPAV
jgi:hypothetical protein